MNFRNIKARILLLTLCVIVITGVGIFIDRTNQSSSESNDKSNATDIWFLAKPALAQDGTFLDDEAGISAYTNLGTAINLSIARTGFKTIEKETADYIVGSLALPDLPETEDVHCFVHKDGWIVTYYLKSEPTSKVIGWVYSSQGSLITKLKVGIDEMCNTLGTVVSNISYYHFHYPLANRWMVIIECATSTDPDSFNLNIPSDFTVYERSWSHYAVLNQPSYTAHSYFDLDGNRIDSLTEPGGTHHGTLTLGQLGPDNFHNAVVDTDYFSGGDDQACISIVLVYLEP